MNKKTTKRALLLSALSVLLCVSMLIGSTFAWFTDTASTGVNTITSGNLDIKLSYMNAAANDYTEVSENATDLFVDSDNEAILWEPGATAVCYFKLENVGSLALKYKMKVSFKDTVTYTNAEDKEVKLSDALKSALVTDLTEKETLTNAEAITAATEDGAVIALGYADEQDVKMESGETAYFAMVIHMPTTVDNTYNLPTGAEALQIQLGINLQATQVPHEFDSFDDQYDKNATYSAKSADELTDALKNAKDGDIIALENDIVLPQMEQTGAGEVTLNLAGNKLTLGTPEQRKDGLVLDEGATLNIINTGSEPTTIEYTGNSASNDAIYVDGGATLNIAGNVNIVASPEASSVIHATEGSVVNIGDGTNIVVKGETDNQFPAIFIERNAVVNMTGGTITLESNLTVEDDGWNNDAVGVVLRGANAYFNMSGGTINVHSKNAMAQGIQICTENGVGSCVANITGGTFNVSNIGTQGGSYAFAFFDTRVGEMNVSGGSFLGNYTAAVMEPAIGSAADANVNLTGGTFAFDPTAYAPAGCEVTDNGDGTYSVKALYTVEGNTITIVEPAALNEAIAAAKASGEAMTIKLPAGELEIPDVSQNWGALEISLVGATNEDGTPATVINVTENKNWGLKGTVQNIAFKDSTNSKIVKFMDGNSLHADVLIDNCVFDGASMQFTGIATIQNCVFNGNGKAWSGIQYSAPEGNILIENCQFSGYCFTNLQVTDEGAHKELTVTVRGCKIGTLSENAVDYAEGVTLYVDTIVLENNTVDCDVWTPNFASVTKTNNVTSANGEVSYKNW